MNVQHRAAAITLFGALSAAHVGAEDAAREFPRINTIGSWRHVLEEHLGRRHGGDAAVCLVGVSSGENTALRAALTQALINRYPRVRFYPSCSPDARTLWLQESRGKYHISDRPCECSYRWKWRWFRRRVTGVCLCE